MAFEPGMRVHCVNASSAFAGASPVGGWKGDLDGLAEGQVYTVRETVVSPVDGQQCLRLAEIVRPGDAFFWQGEPGYLAARFRLLRTTSIEVFNSLLHPSPEDISHLADIDGEPVATEEVR